ncbi:MAG: Mu-like prophage major head subunit gpT family protein [Polyangiaceae bacterium]|nr:Mu-like prophage major head subunit gpT family protein [Polyangiaceae bacterium]
MSVITPSFIHQVDHNIRILSEDSYLRLTQNMWWDQCAKVENSVSKVEQLVWMLTTARIERTGSIGEVPFEDLVELTHSVEMEPAAAGLRLGKDELTDADGHGLKRAAKWATDIGRYMAYFPQAMISEAILGGEASVKSFDGEFFFSETHPNNPFRSSAGTYSNLLDGGNALPINGNYNTAVDNFAAACAHVGSIMCADGKTPRNLKVKAVLVPPKLKTRADLITKGRFGPVGGVAATADLAPASFSDIEVFSAAELSLAAGGDDTSYYLITDAIVDSDTAPFLYVEREAFTITNHDEFTDAEIRRSQAFEYIVRGRNAVTAAFPYGMIKVKAS